MYPRMGILNTIDAVKDILRGINDVADFLEDSHICTDRIQGIVYIPDCGKESNGTNESLKGSLKGIGDTIGLLEGIRNIMD